MSRWVSAALAPSLALGAVLLASCGGADPPFPAAPPYVNPRATPVSCPAPALVSGGTDLAPDPAGACVRSDRASALAPVAAGSPFGWADLGTFAVGTVVPFQVPAGTASITLVEQEVASFLDTVTLTQAGRTVTVPNAAVPAILTDPGGTVVYSDYVPSAGPGGLLENGTLAAQAGVISYPNTSAALNRVGTAGVAPGAWQVTVSDYAYECWQFAQPAPPQAGISCDAPSRRNDGQYRLFLLSRPASTAAGATHAIPDTGAIDVAIHIVDAPTPVVGFAAADAPASPVAQRLARTYASYLASAGLCVGTVTFLDAPAWARSRFGAGLSTADEGPCGDVSQLLTTSVPGARTLDLFLVTRITDPATPQGRTAGVDGTVPGPATVNGTVASGAVVSAEDLGFGACPAPTSLSCGTDLVAYVAAHESGHYLGLFHPSEADGLSFDPLSDTPHCESTCGGSGGVSAARCLGSSRCSGGLNLMFWQVDPSVSLGILSPDQGRVARASPLVRSP